MDKKTQKLMEGLEALCVKAEGAIGEQDEDTIALAITLAYELGQGMNDMELAKKTRNQAAQKTIRANTAAFKPMVDRVSKAREELRQQIMAFLMPSGDAGNMPLEEMKTYGEDGKGVASVIPGTEYDYDLKLLVKHHPDLLKPDTAAIAKRIKAGELPKGVTPKTGYTLRLS